MAKIGHVASRISDTAAAGADDSCQEADQGSFTTAIVTRNDHQLARCQAKIHRMEYRLEVTFQRELGHGEQGILVQFGYQLLESDSDIRFSGSGASYGQAMRGLCYGLIAGKSMIACAAEGLRYGTFAGLEWSTQGPDVQSPLMKGWLDQGFSALYKLGWQG
jgi:hypothetical protein